MLYRLVSEHELAKMRKEEGLMLRGVKGRGEMAELDAEVEGMTNKKGLEVHSGEDVGPLATVSFSRARKVRIVGRVIRYIHISLLQRRNVEQLNFI